ncbi:MAG: acyltransferase [Rubrivivax sp.]|nr:acyltransferase [Rubrivivax sp.]
MSTSESSDRLRALDGWRAASILLVLAAHLLPLGPSSWQLNDSAGKMGMALFFCLSGFLITRFLWNGAHVGDFMIRRICRVVPLAWLGILVGMMVQDHGSPWITWLRHFSFTSNLPPIDQAPVLTHYWSLGVEMQFYFVVALIYGFFGRKGLYALPVLALLVTAHRIDYGATADIATYRRIDEILAGCTLALAYSGAFGLRVRQGLADLSVPLMLVLLVMCSLPEPHWANYIRPYVAACLIGASLVRFSPTFTPILESRFMAYIAGISFALYVIHPLVVDTWLGQADDKVEKYLKRIPAFIVIFALAHLSTHYYENHFMRWGRALSRRLGWEKPRAAKALPPEGGGSGPKGA